MIVLVYRIPCKLIDVNSDGSDVIDTDPPEETNIFLTLFTLNQYFHYTILKSLGYLYLKQTMMRSLRDAV